MYEDNPSRKKEITNTVFMVKVLTLIGSILVAMQATKANCKVLAFCSWVVVALTVLLSFGEVRFGREEDEDDFEEEKDACDCGCSCCDTESELDDLDTADFAD